MRTYIDVHVLQSVPPSNLNRDDAGSPKQAMYGGARRARVSSQAWKRATRKAFKDHLDETKRGTRTKKISALLADRLAARGGLEHDNAARIANSLLTGLGIKPSKRKDTETSYLLFFGNQQVERLVDLVAADLPRLAGLPDNELKEEVHDVPVVATLGEGHPVDVALFGRMVADLPRLNVDAATQVAHALSTHAVETEFDYFTAVDDENERGDTGAGMIGTVEFNSATLYRFATVGLEQLSQNLDGDLQATVEALRVFLTCFVTAMPTGHQNTFAHRTTPALVTVAIRDDQPVNLVSAFEAPVTANGHGLVGGSIQRLAAELTRASDLWGLPRPTVISTYALAGSAPADQETAAALGEPRPFPELVHAACDAARARLAGAAV
jgi:CRISPR system Cascade subunit CasC